MACIAIPIGVISAIKQYSIFDIIVTTLAFIGQAIPEFWLGLVLLLVFYGTLNNPFTGESLFPPGGMQTIGAESSLPDRIHHLILPVTMGAVGWVAWYSRFLRSSMLDVIHQDYVRTAQGKGSIGTGGLVPARAEKRRHSPGDRFCAGSTRHLCGVAVRRADILLARYGAAVLPIRCQDATIRC